VCVCVCVCACHDNVSVMWSLKNDLIYTKKNLEAIFEAGKGVERKTEKHLYMWCLCACCGAHERVWGFNF